MGASRHTVEPATEQVRRSLSEGLRRVRPDRPAGGGGNTMMLALQRRAGNAAVTALMSGKARVEAGAGRSSIDTALNHIRREAPDIDVVEEGLKAAKLAGVPVDLEGTKPPPSALAVTKTGFGPGAVAPKKAPVPKKPVAPKSPLGKTAAKSAKPAKGGGAGGGSAKGGAPAGVAAGAASVLSAGHEHQPPVAPERLPPEQDPAFAAVVAGVGGVAKAKAIHPSAAAKAEEAQGAALAPTGDKEGQAKVAKADEMDAQQAGAFDKKAFIAAVKTAIEAKSPRTLEEADEYSESGKAGEVKGEVKGLVGSGKQEQAGDIETATAAAPDQSKAVEKPVTPVKAESAGAAGAIAGGGAAPKPAPAEQLNLAQGPHEADQEMASAGVDEDQLARSNEPAFAGALADKKEASAHSESAPGEFRQQEQQVITASQGEAQQETSAGVASMQSSRVGGLAGLAAQQGEAKSADEVKRDEVTAKVQSIFDAAETDVKTILDGIDPKVETAFETGEARARSIFERYVKAKMSAYKQDRYSGITGGLKWAKDKIVGMPAKVDEFYEAGRELYLTEMNKVISTVADIVGDDLGAAKKRIATGKLDIAKYVTNLPADLRSIGNTAATEIGSGFDQLESDVSAKQDAVVDTLASKYVEARAGLDERIEALQAENKGLVDKAIGAIKAVVNTIRELTAMLTGVLARAAGVVGDIVKDPIGFLGNLIAGVKGGILKFKDNIVEHLRKGLMGWLFGALAEGGIELPDTFDIKGILKLLASIFGLTWANIRNRLVRQIGEKAMGVVEKGVEIFQLIASEGVGGLWEMLVEKLGDVKESIMEKVQSFVKDKIITAGITWLIGLLNPAAAFIKACKLIYDVIMFFVNNGSRILAFVNTVIDSVADIVRGNVGGVVDKIEDVLGKMLPIMISFFASVIGLGGIGQKIREIVQTLQRPFQRALDFLIRKGLQLAGPLIRGARNLGARARAAIRGGDDSPEGKQRRLEAGVRGGVSAANRFAGRAVGDRVLIPVLGAIRTRYGLSVLEPVKQGRNWAIHGVVSRMTVKSNAEVQESSGGPGAVGAGTREGLIRDAKALIGQRVLLTEGDVVGVIESVNEEGLSVLCRFDFAQGRGRNRGLARGYGLEPFLNSYNTTHQLVKPHSGGNHRSRYAIEDRSTGGYVLDPAVRRSWRSLFYGSSYGPRWDAWKLRRLTTAFGTGDGLRHPDDSNLDQGQRWIYEGTEFRHVTRGPGEATLDHDPPVVSHWNAAGHNVNQSTRRDWFQLGPFEIMPRSVNASWGSFDESTGERGAAQWALGEEFRGPGEVE